MPVTIIDYKAGNIASVVKAFQHLGADTIVTSAATDIATADSLVLPGVGHFSATRALDSVRHPSSSASASAYPSWASAAACSFSPSKPAVARLVGLTTVNQTIERQRHSGRLDQLLERNRRGAARRDRVAETAQFLEMPLVGVAAVPGAKSKRFSIRPMKGPSSSTRRSSRSAGLPEKPPSRPLRTIQAV